ncbi:tyrosine-protein phosphatase [Streptomyces laurentii]|uniref:tyrosine-protein phosphatase n=1 Tax=Streptomyces laurentii TaxID=39478 RepID=UPI0033F6058F
MTSPAPVRVDGVRNLRDAGGVGALPPGTLFRSGALHALAPDGARQLAALGIRTVVDLRSRPEAAERPDALHGVGIAHAHVPVFAERGWPAGQPELYEAMAGRAGHATLAVLRRLTAEGAEDGGPVLVHCASGKDRTGVVVAAVRSLFGASEAEVTADFVRSNAELGLSAAPLTSEAMPGHNTLPVAPAHLLAALRWIRAHHGSLPAWLRAHGATERELAALPPTAV